MSIGILNPLYDAVAWLIMRIHAILAVPLGPASGATWALTIVVLVVLMRLLLLPLFVKQMHAQQKMLQLNPQVQELRKRYKGDKQKLNEEMMKLYRENGANPLSGCLPLVAQLPVWFALFSVLRAISQGRTSYGLTKTVVDQANRAHIFGVTIADRFLFSHTHTAANVKIVIVITVLLSAVTTFFTVRQSMKRGMMQSPGLDESNPMAGAQKYMAYIAPLFALSGLYWQFGLVLYWLTTNVWTLGQQYFLFKKIPPLNAATATAGSGTAPAPAGARTAGGAKPSGTPKAPAADGFSGTAGAKSRTAQPAAARPVARSKGTGATAAKPSAQTPSTRAQSAQSQSAQSQSARGPSAGGPSAGGPSARAKPAAARQASAAKPGTAGLGIPPPTPNGGGGVLRKLVRGRAEPEPEPEPPEVKMVRQQRPKQSRSKRTGKR